MVKVSVLGRLRTTGFMLQVRRVRPRGRMGGRGHSKAAQSRARAERILGSSILAILTAHHSECGHLRLKGSS